LGWSFGILYVLAVLQAGFFAYDQILNDSRIEMAAQEAISKGWLALKSR
jgi:hypothetical protein